MGAVNSCGESRLSERVLGAVARGLVNIRQRENGGIPGLFRADQLTERLSA
jgi:hypothetical protein